MTTPNGQQPPEPNGVSETSAPKATPRATSTVLPLDGWGPLISGRSERPNGSNGSYPAESMLNGVDEVADHAVAAAVQPPFAPAAQQTQTSRRSLAPDIAPVLAWRPGLPRISLPQYQLRALAPATAMAAAALASLWIGGAIRINFSIAGVHLPSLPTLSASRNSFDEASSQIAALRRSLALAIDPSLAPVEAPPAWWKRWLQ